MEDASEYTFKIVLLGVIALVCILSFFILCASTPAFKNLGRDGKQCDDETDGTYSNGDRRGMFYQRDTSGIN